VEDLRQDVASSPTSLIRRHHSLIIGALSSIALFFLYVLSIELIIRGSITDRLEEIKAIQDRHFEKYLADAEFIETSEIGILLNSKRSAAATPAVDAGPRLNKLVLWAPLSSEYGRKETLVPAASREFLLRYQDDWIKGRSFLERGRLKGDATLFDKLDGFEIWDIETATPLADLIKSEKFLSPHRLPSPDTLDLLSVTKIRLLKGTLDGKPKVALAEVRKFASLLLTTESLQLLLTGLAVLDLERRAYREYVDRALMSDQDWRPIDANTTARANRAFLATGSYLSAMTDETKFAKILGLPHLPPAFCAGINQRLPADLSLRDQLTGIWPFERTYKEGFKRLDAAAELAKKNCRVKLFRVLYDEAVYESVDPSAPWPLAILPYFRTVFALRDLSNWPIYFDGYARN
jgi:hypothetical protein